MKYKLTLLNVPAFLLLAGAGIYTAINYRGLINGEGWGIVLMGILLMAGIAALIIDFAIQWLVKNTKARLITSLFFLLVFLGTLYALIDRQIV